MIYHKNQKLSTSLAGVYFPIRRVQNRETSREIVPCQTRRTR
jgi:hypothetical protein